MRKARAGRPARCCGGANSDAQCRPLSGRRRMAGDDRGRRGCCVCGGGSSRSASACSGQRRWRRPPNPQLAAAQAVFESLPEAERKAIQTDLIWVGIAQQRRQRRLWSADLPRDQPGEGRAAPPTACCPRPSGRRLAQAARAARDSVGFKLIDGRAHRRAHRRARAHPAEAGDDALPGAAAGRARMAGSRSTSRPRRRASRWRRSSQKATAANPNNPGPQDHLQAAAAGFLRRQRRDPDRQVLPAAGAGAAGAARFLDRLRQGAVRQRRSARHRHRQQFRALPERTGSQPQARPSPA